MRPESRTSGELPSATAEGRVIEPGTREARLTSTFVKLADTLVAEYDIIDLLDTLVNSSAELLDATAAGLLLASEQGELEVVASTSEQTRLVELMQLNSGEGPCLECFRTGTVVTVPDVREGGDRWPAFQAAAIEQNLLSVHAVPLRLRDTVIGAMNLFSDRPGLLTPDDITAAQGLADIATIGILQERAVREGSIARSQLQYALDSRVVIEQAKGVLAHTHGVDMDAAFRMLRQYARSHNAPLRRIADSVVSRTLTIDPL